MTTVNENNTTLESLIIKSITLDDKNQLISLFTSTTTTKEERFIISRIFHQCCLCDSIDCSTALLNGEVLGLVPLVNDDVEKGMTPLHAAAESHASRCVELLLKKHARTDCKSKDGRGLLPLELALCSHRMDVIWNPDEHSIEDLIVCLGEKDLTTVKLLSEKTKEVQDVAYAMAIKGRVVQLAALLAVATVKVMESKVVLHDENGCKETSTIYECVIREALALDSRSKSKTIAARSSCDDGDYAERRKLLLCEIELFQLFGAIFEKSTDRKVISPLIVACQEGDEVVIELLLKTDIDVNDVDAAGNSALHCAIKPAKRSIEKQLRLVSILLKHGARVNQKNPMGLNAVHVAASNGILQVLEVLLMDDSNCINSKSATHETPLFFAVKNDHMDCVELLLRWGAECEALNLRKNRAIDFAKSQDMRSLLSPVNISALLNRKQRQHDSALQIDEAVLETCEALLKVTQGGSTMERMLCPKHTTEVCKSINSPLGCANGEMCFYAHNEEDLSPTAKMIQLLDRRIFVGGLPSSVKSDSLSKFFEKEYGPVEDAIVMRNETGSESKSRGFGFVTFKNKKSVSEAVQAHYTTIMGKQVEIKDAVPKFLMELHKISPKQLEQNQDDQNLSSSKTNDVIKSELKSWVRTLLQDQNLKSSPASQPHNNTSRVEQNQPMWLTKLKNWLPSFLKSKSKNSGYYALSSLKVDFKIACGLELDHSSLGYSKLSDFMKSCPGLCQMKYAPEQNHVILLPCRPQSSKLLQRTDKSPVYSCAALNKDSDDGNSDSSKCNVDKLSVSCDASSLISSSSSSSVEKMGTSVGKTSRLPDKLSSGISDENLSNDRPPNVYSKEREKGIFDEERTLNEGMKLCSQREHLVLEALARKRNNSSLFFLREFDFYDWPKYLKCNKNCFISVFKNYKATISKRKCFGCNQRLVLWANYPCQHMLWCTRCKVEFSQAAGSCEHFCVICDAQVQKITLLPSSNGCSQSLHEYVCNDAEFPPLITHNNVRPSIAALRFVY
ncbi:hypothetical protein ACFE04_008263 [Oxalis oulophora]